MTRPRTLTEGPASRRRRQVGVAGSRAARAAEPRGGAAWARRQALQGERGCRRQDGSVARRQQPLEQLGNRHAQTHGCAQDEVRGRGQGGGARKAQAKVRVKRCHRGEGRQGKSKVIMSWSRTLALVSGTEKFSPQKTTWRRAVRRSQQRNAGGRLCMVPCRGQRGMRVLLHRSCFLAMESRPPTVISRLHWAVLSRCARALISDEEVRKAGGCARVDGSVEAQCQSHTGLVRSANERDA